MRPVRRLHVAPACVLVATSLLFAACSSRRESAQRLIADIDVSMAAAGAAGAPKYLPEQFAGVERDSGELKSSFDQRRYELVVQEGPPVLNAARALAAAAVEKQHSVQGGLEAEWSALADTAPGYLTAIEKRIDLLSAQRKKPPQFNPDAARAAMRRALILWSEAHAAFAAGNLEEAVTTAREAKAKLDALAATLAPTG